MSKASFIGSQKYKICFLNRTGARVPQPRGCFFSFEEVFAPMVGPHATFCCSHCSYKLKCPDRSFKIQSPIQRRKIEKAEGLELSFKRMQVERKVSHKTAHIFSFERRRKRLLLGGQKTVQGVQFSEKCGSNYRCQNTVKLTS